ITVCEKIQTLPGALIRVPAIDMFPVILMMAGIIILCVFKTKLRLIGLGVILTGLILAGYTPKPDIFISDNGQTVAIRREDGTLRFLSIYPYSNTASLWLQKNGEDPHPPHISNPFPPFIYIKQKKIALTEDGCFRAHLCLNHLQKDQTYLIYISDKIKIKTP
ncbi:MAG: hypothetical protein SPL08_01410, partial [Pseudomonadota bacterium]|nr:hypothetical protein [Pseudomonadota bacterium]